MVDFKYPVGTIVRIVHNYCGHSFERGQEIILAGKDSSANSGRYQCGTYGAIYIAKSYETDKFPPCPYVYEADIELDDSIGPEE